MDVVQIGTIHTPFKGATGVPIQPSVAGDAIGTIEVAEEYAEGLRDLDGFDRIWLLFWCHRASEPKLTVIPYRDDKPHGVFSTRAPSRPNSIGLSSVRLVRVEGRTLHVKGVDMLDGTPLIDIKPYVPSFDVFDVARCGWLDTGLDTTSADDRFER